MFAKKNSGTLCSLLCVLAGMTSEEREAKLGPRRTVAPLAFNKGDGTSTRSE
jgi:hypothetical protein